MMKLVTTGVVFLLAVSGASVGQATDRRAPAASGPEAFPALTLIYLAAGVRDSGSAENVGVATTFHCSNFSPAIQQIKIQLRQYNGTVSANSTFNVGAADTLTKSTHLTAITEDAPGLAPGVVFNQGSVAISATTPNFTCTAYVADATNGVEIGNLHFQRFNARAGSQE